MGVMRGALRGLELAGWVGLGLAGLYRFVLRQPWTALDGVVSPPGVKTDVEIARDQAGVPHLYAATARDLFYALGYVHAQDRLWHLELNRRAGQGRLSEIFGEATLGLDRFTRRLGLFPVATAEAAALGPEERTALEGYAAGINGFLGTHRWRLPLEFRILNFVPQPWQIEDSLAWGNLVCWLLSANWDSEWVRARLVENLGVDRASAFERGYPPGQPLTTAPGVAYPKQANAFFAEFQSTLRDLGLFDGGMSNAWAVAPGRSATGGALLASDPHLRPQMPSIWYEAHLCGAGLDVIGATMPGLPAVLIGHNQRIAWGITASMVDTQDLFVERIDPETQCYATPEGAEPLNRRVEEIRVRGRAEPYLEEVRMTRHGPSLTPLLPGENHFLAIQSPVLRADHTARGMLRLNRAQTWEEFRQALGDFDAALNFVYADVEGNIGYQLSGKVPRRKKGAGLLPVPGWDADYDWDGYLDLAELPSTLNPPEGYVVSANNRLVRNEYPFALSPDWIDGFRAERIETILRDREKVSIEDCAALHREVYSEAARQTIDLFADLEPRNGEPLTTRALEYLRRWDFQLLPTSVAATIYQVLRRRLLRNLFQARLGQLFGNYTGCAPADGLAGSAYPGRINGFLIEVLREAEPTWLDGTGFANWDDLKWESLRQAVAELRGRFGDDLETWHWGRLHQLSFDHPLGQVKLLRPIFSRGPYPIGGDGDTPHQAASSAGNDAAISFIPSYRQIVDLADFSNSRAIHTTGQSGLPGNPHYDDFIPLWREGHYHPMHYGRKEILANLEHLLVLRPEGG